MISYAVRNRILKIYTYPILIYPEAVWLILSNKILGVNEAVQLVNLRIVSDTSRYVRNDILLN